MAFVFALTDRTLQAGLHRIARSEVRRIERQLEAGPLAEGSVHDIRKRLKKLRAILRLLRSGMADQRAAETVILRDAGRALAGARDRAVRLASFDRLIGDQVPEDLAGLRARLAADAAVPAPPPPDLRASIASLRDRIDSWRLEGKDRRILTEGLARTRARAIETMKRARKDPDPEHVHAWRKRVKDHWYQARLLSPIWPEAMAPIVAAADRLGEILGDHRDLGLLMAEAAALPPEVLTGAAKADLAGRIGAAQAGIETVAFPLGARLFAGEPDDMAALWVRWWALWRAEMPEG